MTQHNCTIVLDRYPTCSCGSHTWPCKVESAERARAVEWEQDRRLAKAIVDEIERRGR